MPEYTQELSQLIQAFAESGYAVLEVSEGASRVRLKRAVATTAATGPAAATRAVEPAPARSSETPAAPAEAAAEASPVDRSWSLTSPRVGRFFQLQDAQGQPVLKNGSRIATGQVYGIIESMQLRYEIRAEREGLVDRVLVPSGEPVEFGQPLVLLQS
ncbi:MAG: acetyl-CoA carboxylase biotin carboxyl carrier protein [Candidatus Wallbacteria bacterium]|nr:acetyl-CoA carboxylase biotin carboxyl carrier protein [Candidatus Wallbacteria bacterium]